MKRIALVCAAVLLLGAAVFAIVRLPGRGAARAERAAAQPVAQAAPAAETPEPADKPALAGEVTARGKQAATPRNESAAAPEEKPAKGEHSLRLPPDVDVEPIVEVIARMAAAGPASRSQARQLSLVLTKYGVALPSVLSELVAAEVEEATQPTPEEIEQLREPGQILANSIKTRLVNLPLTTPDELEAFYVELLATMASTSASKWARMMAASVLIEFASPPRDESSEPTRWGGDARTAQRAVANSLEFAFDPKQGDLHKDLSGALLQCQYASVPSGYLMLSVLAERERKSEAVDPLLLPLIAQAEELAKGELAAPTHRLLDKALHDLRGHLGKPGSVYTAEIDRWRDIEAFYVRMAAAINKEDKRALATMMPPTMGDKIASADSLRDALGGMPKTQEIVITVMGQILPAGESKWRATVEIRTIGASGNPGAPRIIEHVLERDGEGYRILDNR